MPTVDRIEVYPIKSLDSVSVPESEIVENGALEYDRAYAMFDDTGNYVNGKREPRIYELESDVDLRTLAVTLRDTSTGRRFDLEDEQDAISEWLRTYFDRPVTVRQNMAGGHPDNTSASGPTIISTATLTEVASWFPGLDVQQMRHRFRANIEIADVPAFWEDRLYSDSNHVIDFRIGDVQCEGVQPVPRCVVPTRDPHTGTQYERFEATFVEKRRETLPEWATTERFDHYFNLMTNTNVPESEWGKSIQVGDDVEILGETAIDSVT